MKEANIYSLKNQLNRYGIDIYSLNYNYTNLFHSKKFNITFISNPKAACSSVKASLLENVISNVHVESISRLPIPTDSNSKFFCLTRNPFTRSLSAYLDKIGPNSDQTVWRKFCNRYSLKPDNKISFYTFLKLLSEERNPFNIDPHFRPQIYNLHVKDICPEYVGRVENMNHFSKWLIDQGVTYKYHSPHKNKKTLAYKNIITKTEQDLIIKIFSKDFEEFCYKRDLESSYIPLPIQSTQKFSSTFMQIFSVFRLGLTPVQLDEMTKNFSESKDEIFSQKTAYLSKVIQNQIYYQ
tara:strand:+ start:1220 stop:2104 length:885 start_codon:yes stop_codon:yes gene_type:complete